jgi:hypothetical protein
MMVRSRAVGVLVMLVGQLGHSAVSKAPFTSDATIHSQQHATLSLGNRQTNLT